ncbi:hypothetical protein HYH03_016079 [Edaphochlamys debaryana]|uniref:Thioredoxin domain-containing protein n=1 Tax=Edaphochlamys debaryana TaxID=47281 RepID=A0A835XKQ0_9CHLO|nr:hypothetical protein HYH03_016079 [Edaphochlamys debaryana]|eukprot:KAG2485190.1 hypothetical protein HYH03_016079 [Edaphochlamys debaryana]
MAALQASSARGIASAVGASRRIAPMAPRVAVQLRVGSSPVPSRAVSQLTPARRCTAAAGKVEKINGEQLEVAIASRDTTLIVDFFATWCGPCLLLAKELEQVAEAIPDKVKVVKIDVDENPDLANMLRIQGLPTIVFIPKENGKPALRTEGWLPAAQIMEIVGQLDAGQQPGAPLQQQPSP